jgi:hypothetical protein
MRLLLLLAVIALGADALYFSGAYTQALWREASVRIEGLVSDFADRPVRTQTSSTTDDRSDIGGEPRERN